MKKRAVLLLFIAMSGCENNNAEPGEIPGTITGYTEIDNWGKFCSTGGLMLQIDKEYFMISNAVPAVFEEPDNWPVEVWTRFKTLNPDSCTLSANRIEILTIRKR